MPRSNVPSRPRCSGRALQSSLWSASPPPVVRTPRASTPIPSPPTARLRRSRRRPARSRRARPRAAASRRSRCRRRAGPRPSPPAAASPMARRGWAPIGRARIVRRHRIGAPRLRRAEAGRRLDLGRRFAGDRRLRRNGRDDRAQARRAGRPPCMQTNGITNATAIKPGQRLVIPRYVSAARRKPARAAPPRTARNRSRRRARREPGRHRAPLRRDADGAGESQQPPAQWQDQHRRPADDSRRPSGRRAPDAGAAGRAAAHGGGREGRQRAGAELRASPRPTPPTTDTVAKTAEPAGAMPSFRWPVRGRVIAGFGANAERHAERRHQSGGAGRHAGQGRRRRRRRLCRQRTQGLRQSGADPPSQRLRVGLRACQRAAGQARRHHQARAGDRECRADRQRDLAATALRDPQGLDPGRSGQVSRRG